MFEWVSVYPSFPDIMSCYLKVWVLSIRVPLRIGKENLTWKLCREYMEYPFLITKWWRNGKKSRKKPKTGIIGKLERCTIPCLLLLYFYYRIHSLSLCCSSGLIFFCCCWGFFDSFKGSQFYVLFDVTF